MRKRKPEGYRNGDFTLGVRDGDAVADYRDENDKRRRARLGVPFATSGEAFDAAKAALDKFAEAQRAVRKQQAEHTVGDLWRMWMKERAADKLNNAIYGFNWRALEPFFGSRSPALLVTQDYRDYAQARFDAGRKPWTVHTELVRLRGCFKWAFAERHIPVLPKVWVPRAGKSRERVLSIEEARRLVETARLHSDPHIYLFVVIAFATGARHTAILDLTWDRIDFGCYPDDGDIGQPRMGMIEFDEDLPPDPMSKAWRKGRATVPMNRAVRAALKEAYPGRRTKHVVEHGGKRLKDIGDGFKAAVERAGLGHMAPHPTKPDEQIFVTDVTPHTIRHTVATWLEAKAIDDKRRAQLLGHAGPAVTNKVYTHSSHELLHEAVTLLDAEFAPLPKIDHQEVEKGGEDGSEMPRSVPSGQGGQPSGISG